MLELENGTASRNAPERSAVGLKDMGSVSVARRPTPPPCCYYGTSAVLPLAETFPTAKRLQHKYTISGGGRTPGVSQALRAQKHSDGAANAAGSATLSVRTYTQRSLQALLRRHTAAAAACRWRDSSVGRQCWRWSVCGGVGFLLLCMIGYFVWLRGLPHGQAAAHATTTTTAQTPTPMTTAATVVPHLRTNAIGTDAKGGTATLPAWPRSAQTLPPRWRGNGADEDGDSDDDRWYDVGLLEPNESVETAAAVRNLTVLRLASKDDNLLQDEQGTPSTARPRSPVVSPTIPSLRHWSSVAAAAAATAPLPDTGERQQESGCRSTSLPLCQGVLDYDLTSGAAAGAPLSADERTAFEMLANSNCSARALEFVCTVLEPECRPTGAILPPCRRICKAILEACSTAVASSDVLTAIFDCGTYPDASEAERCDDPTRRRDYCYANEFACADRSCIPHHWQCDNIKDCAAGDDEDSCLLCEQQDEFRCRSNEKCVAAAQRCDQREDCFDGSDEANCEDYLYSEELPLDAFYAPAALAFNDATADAPAALLSKYNELLQSIAAQNGSGDAGAPRDDAANILTSESKAQGFVHFRDSKEIMMTSDTENKFKYSTTTRGNRTYYNNNSNNSNNNNNSNNKAHATSATSSTAALLKMPMPLTEAPPAAARTTASSSSGGGTCAPHQLRCVSGHCITVQQICDKKIDCPDGADELMCVYKQRNGAASTTTSSTTDAAAAAAAAASASTATSSGTSSTMRLPSEMKRKTTIRKLRGQQYQQQQG